MNILNNQNHILKPTQTMLVDRRNTPRRHIEIELGIYSDSNFYSGFTHDISEGGVFAATYVPLPVGTKLSLHLSLPGGFEIRATGVVRWIRVQRDPDCLPPGMGIRFDEIADEDSDLIREFVEGRDPYFYAEQ